MSQYIPPVGAQNILLSLYFTVIATNVIVLFGPHRMRNIMLSVFRLMLDRQYVCKSDKPLAAEACLVCEK